jgi:hypothetical protein
MMAPNISNGSLTSLAVLRPMASKLLPERIAARAQHGLVVPLLGFFASIGRDKLWHMLRNPEALWRSVFKEKPVLEILDRYENGDSSLTFFIYQMVNAEMWRERWLSEKLTARGT